MTIGRRFVRVTAMCLMIAMAALLILLYLLNRISSEVSKVALAAPGDDPTVTGVDPSSAPNDLNTPITITGSGFAAGLSGTLTLVITPPTVYLGDLALGEAGWINSSTLEATVPWGLVPDVYTLAVVNPGGQSGSLPGGFTVTQGFGVWTTNGPYGGTIHQVLLHPVTPTTVYAVATWAGVYASYDAGGTWEMILRDDSPTRMAFDAGDPAVIYYGGESWGTILRTTDGGATWERLQESFPYRSQYGCYRVYPASHPISSGVVYAGTGSCGGIPVAPGTGGVYRSDDYGSTWLTMTVGLTDTDIADIAFDPDDPDKMLVGTQNGNLFLSTDGGGHWSWAARLASSVRRVYFNPFGAHEAWATTAREPVPPPYLYKSADPDLAVWTPITVTDVPGWSYPVHSLTFISDTVWAAAAYGFTSTDGGASWSPLGWAGQPDDNVAEFAIDPHDPDVVYAGRSTGGVFKSSDGGSTWGEANDGLAAVIPQALAVPEAEPDIVYAYTYEQGLLKSQNGGRSWMWLRGRAGGTPSPEMLAVDPFLSTRLYLGHRCHHFLCLYVSEDAGATWREVTTTVPITLSGMEIDMDVVAPHPSVPGRIVAGMTLYPPDPADPLSGGVFVSDDYGESWEYGWPPPTEPFSPVVVIAYDATDPNLVYAGTGGTGLWKSTDLGETWRTVPISGALPPVGIASIAPHPDASRTVYVRLYSTAATPNPEAELYVSRNAGTTWVQLGDVEQSGGLWFVPPQPGKPPYVLYTVSAVDGLYRSYDGGQNWLPVKGVPRPYVLAAGSDNERVVVYVGSLGGVVSAGGPVALASQAIPGRGNVMGGGVYRLTTRLTPPLYLPLVVKAYAPSTITLRKGRADVMVIHCTEENYEQVWARVQAHAGR
jgi:photosystem II stability/assembly factor-like uncharacterized protein